MISMSLTGVMGAYKKSMLTMSSLFLLVRVNADGQFVMPKGIAIDAAGNIYVSDKVK